MRVPSAEPQTAIEVVPVLIALSPRDDIVPSEHGRALFAATHPPRKFLELAGDHNDSFVFVREEWVWELDDFLGAQAGASCPR